MSFYELEKKLLDGKKLSDEDIEFVSKRAEFYWNNHPDTVVKFPRWSKILAWVAGYQNFDYNFRKKELQKIELEGRIIRVNRLKPILRTMLGKIRAVSPEIGVVPNTNDYEDVEAAKLGDMVIESLSRAINFEKIRKEFFAWLLLLNRACIRVFWDETKSGVVGYNEEVDESLGLIKTPVEERGEIAMEVVPPFNYRHDPLYSDPDKWRWFLHGELVDREMLADAYDVPVDNIKPASELNNNLINPRAFVDRLDDILNTSGSITPYDNETCIKYELWTPNMYFIIGGGVVLDYGVNEKGVIPYFSYEDKLIPLDNYEKSVNYNDSIFKELLSPQHEYNRQLTLISRAIERASKVKVLSPLNALLNKKQVYDDGGLVMIDYNPQLGEPHQLKVDELPPLSIPFKQELERELENVSGVHEVSFGRLPERASHASGVLVNLLLEQDDNTLDPIIREVDNVFSKAWSYALYLVQDKYTTRRLLKLVGKDKEESVIYFEGADLKGNTDVVVTTNTNLPKSRALRSEWIMRLAQMGLIQNPRTVLEMLEFGDAKSLYNTELIHEKRAMRENYQLKNNHALTTDEIVSWVYDLDDHAIHITIHLRERLSPSYEQLTDSQKEGLEQHIRMHLARLQAQMPANPMSTPEETQNGSKPPAPQNGGEASLLG